MTNYTNVKTFVDTNILVYAYDRGSGIKHQKTRDELETLWRERSGTLSIQVLQEFYVNIRRKALRPVSIDQARSLISDYLAWNPVINDSSLLLSALECEERFKVSFWDAMILAAAKQSGAGILLSEDFGDGQSYDDVLVRNPFV